jgi:hypothetical protein
MRSGDVMAEAWDAYRRHWRHLLPLAFVVYVLISLLALLLAVLLDWVGVVIGALISLAGVFWLQGALVVAIDDVRDGRADLSIQETLSRLRPRLNTLTLAGLGAAVAISLGFLALVIPGLVLFTFWLLIVPVIVLERAGVFSSFGRSFELVRGYFWSVFGVLILTLLVVIAVGIVLSLVSGAADSVLVDLLVDIASQTVTAPFVALAWTMTYYRLRALRETPAGETAVELGR